MAKKTVIIIVVAIIIILIIIGALIYLKNKTSISAEPKNQSKELQTGLNVSGLKQV